MKLSIIIVSYNEGGFLSATIESCLQQKFDYEIIIGDDGSTDGSIELIKEYVAKYPDIIKYFVMDRNDAKDIIPSIRVSNVLKKAFEISNGEYLTVISGDDINLTKDRYLMQVSFLDSNRQYCSCYTDYKKFWNDGQEVVCSLRASLNENIFWACQYVHVSCFVFRNKCLNNILDRFCDDTGLIFSILNTGKSKHLKCLGFGYRQRDKSIMHESDKVELALLEMALLQDCLNHGGMYNSSLSRFAKPLQYLCNNRELVKATKYKKYLDSNSIYPNDITSKIFMDEQAIRYLLYKCKLYEFYYRIVRKVNILINIIKKN